MEPLHVIRTQSDRFAEVLAATDPAARVPTCPDWTAADLLWHLTEVHLFWAGILGTNARSEADVEAVESAKPDRPNDLAALTALRAEATGRLLDQLSQLDDAEPRWSWWEDDQTVGFTRRMQTCEATVHRVDAELTAGMPVSPVDPELAERLVDHCVQVMWAGWLPDWGQHHPRAVVRLEATDIGRDWLVEFGHWTGTGPESGTAFDVPRAVSARPGAEPQATVRGPAVDLALWAWTRGDAVTVDGSPDAVAAVAALIAHGID